MYVYVLVYIIYAVKYNMHIHVCILYALYYDVYSDVSLCELIKCMPVFISVGMDNDPEFGYTDSERDGDPEKNCLVARF
jgi:hypothetical protein